MNLINEIEEIVSRLDDNPRFSYMGRYEHNVHADHQDYSTGVVNLFEVEQPGFRINENTGAVRNVYPVFIEFVKLVKDMQVSAVERDVVIREMQDMAGEFLVRLNQSDVFEVVANSVKGLTVIERYDANLCGIELNFELTSFEPLQIC